MSANFISDAADVLSIGEAAIAMMVQEDVTVWMCGESPAWNAIDVDWRVPC